MTVALSAPAKLTLSLRVLGGRDDGFHELEALTVSVSAPADRVSVVEAEPGAVALALDGRTDGVPPGEENLVVRAARAVLPEGVGVRIALHKVIPPGAGLGGGSSDAAAVLRALRDHFGADPGAVDAAAMALGSDVPFCVDGGPAWMRGRGEVLDPVEVREELHVLVVVPPFSLATPPVYRAWDELGGPRSRRAVPAPRAVAHLVDELANDLEPAAEHVEPHLLTFRESLEAAVGTRALLAGSGSACWVPYADPDEARAAAEAVGDRLGFPAFLATSLRREGAAPRAAP